MRRTKNWVNYLAWFFLHKSNAYVRVLWIVIKKKHSQKSYGISYKIPAGLQTNSLSTPFMGGKLCVKNISQCFNCIYFWSFPDLIYDRIFITTHLCIDYQKKQSILDSLYLQMNDRCKKKRFAVYRLYGIRG